MRRTITRPTSSALSGICAACARKTSASTIASRAVLATRPYSTNSNARAKLPSTALPPARCFLSTSAARRASQETSNTPEGAPTSTEPTTAPASLPYYALFPQTLAAGPPPSGPFKIDTRALHREFLQLQAASHPDFHHASTALLRRKAEAVSSHINTAYVTLASPLLRAQYIVAARYGRDLAGDEAQELSGPADPDVLMVVLEAREVIEEAEDEKELEGVRAENEERIETCVGALERAFGEEDVEGAVRETVRLRYWMNIRDSVNNWEAGKPVVLQH